MEMDRTQTLACHQLDFSCTSELWHSLGSASFWFSGYTAVLCKWSGWPEGISGEPWRLTRGQSAWRNHPLGFRITTGDRAGVCSQALSSLCYLKQISFALQRQSAEKSIMCTLCLTRPIGQILPEEKIKLWKKWIIFTQPQDRDDMLMKFRKSQFWKTLKNDLAKELSQFFPHAFHFFLSFTWEIWVKLYLTVLEHPVQLAWMMGLSPQNYSYTLLWLWWSSAI